MLIKNAHIVSDTEYTADIQITGEQITAKETIKTGAQAAAHGGFTTVVAMSNLNPVPDTVATLKPLLAKNRSDAKITVRQFAPITRNLHSDQVVDMPALQAAGALGFSNDGVGVQDADTMYQAMLQAAKLNAPIVPQAFITTPVISQPAKVWP